MLKTYERSHRLLEKADAKIGCKLNDERISKPPLDKTPATGPQTTLELPVNA
jgi:hypothetical protein